LFEIQAKQDASELLQRKADLEREKKALEDLVVEKDAALQKKIKTIGNYVHDSVPVSNDEVRQTASLSHVLLIG
jgi:seryl-tRNA synthetase